MANLAARFPEAHALVLPAAPLQITAAGGRTQNAGLL
jgi:hypothetical protein